jgi:hypothetical protein
MVRGWIIASLITPLGYLAVSVFGGGKEAATLPFDIFWPGSLCLMVSENQPLMSTIVCVWLTSSGTKRPPLYAASASSWPIARLGFKR